MSYRYSSSLDRTGRTFSFKIMATSFWHLTLELLEIFFEVFIIKSDEVFDVLITSTT
jgi:hypothetical protein